MITMKEINYQITKNGAYFDIIENTIENGKLTKWKTIKKMCFETEQDAFDWIISKKEKMILKQYEKELENNKKIKEKLLNYKNESLTKEEIFLITDALFLHKRQLEESIEILKDTIRKD